MAAKAAEAEKKSGRGGHRRVEQRPRPVQRRRRVPCAASPTPSATRPPIEAPPDARNAFGAVTAPSRRTAGRRFRANLLAITARRTVSERHHFSGATMLKTVLTHLHRRLHRGRSGAAASVWYALNAQGERRRGHHRRAGPPFPKSARRTPIPTPRRASRARACWRSAAPRA